MELQVQQLDQGVRCIHLTGRLDLKGTQQIDSQFTEQAAGAKRPVVVDLSQVEFIASVGIRLLLTNMKALGAAGAKMVFLNPPKLVEDVLRLAGLDMSAPILHDEAAAIQLAKNSGAAA